MFIGVTNVFASLGEILGKYICDFVILCDCNAFVFEYNFPVRFGFPQSLYAVPYKSRGSLAIYLVEE